MWVLDDVFSEWLHAVCLGSPLQHILAPPSALVTMGQLPVVPAMNQGSVKTGYQHELNSYLICLPSPC